MSGYIHSIQLDLNHVFEGKLLSRFDAFFEYLGDSSDSWCGMVGNGVVDPDVVACLPVVSGHKETFLGIHRPSKLRDRNNLPPLPIIFGCGSIENVAPYQRGFVLPNRH